MRILGILFLLLSACCHTPHSNSKAHAFRLQPGQDLRLSLEKYVTDNKIKAASLVSAVGSLKLINIRWADQKNPKSMTGPVEIVSLIGTLGPDGSHLHISVSDSQGKTSGGHLAEGNIIYTTAEIVLLEITNMKFKREADSTTTFKELTVIQDP